VGDLYLALLHHPVYDKNGDVVTTAVTNMDVHDFGRLSRTYGVRAFYVATPVPTLRRLVERIMRHWETGPGAAYNHTRKEALALARLAHDLDAVVADIEHETGVLPSLVATSARDGDGRLGFAALRRSWQRTPANAPRLRDRLGAHRGGPRARRRHPRARARDRRVEPSVGPERGRHHP
jgi:hypothetical protein